METKPYPKGQLVVTQLNDIWEVVEGRYLSEFEEYAYRLKMKAWAGYPIAKLTYPHSMLTPLEDTNIFVDYLRTFINGFE